MTIIHLNNIQKFNPKLEGLISEANKFVNTFGYPISQSLPHIYLSAIPFLPCESVALQRVRQEFQNTLSVEVGRSKTWPVIGQTLIGHLSPVQLVAFSPDSARVVSGCSDTVHVWDAGSCTPICEPLLGHSNPVTSVSFSPDGTRIASGSKDGTIRIWDAVLGMPIGEPLLGHLNHVLSVAFSFTGTRVVSGSADNTIRIWDAETGAPIGKLLQGHTDWVQSIAHSPDGGHFMFHSYCNIYALRSRRGAYDLLAPSCTLDEHNLTSASATARQIRPAPPQHRGHTFPVMFHVSSLPLQCPSPSSALSAAL